MSGTRPKALVLGASGYYQRSIEALKRAGIWVAAVDRNPDAPGLAVADASAVVDIIDIPGVLAAAKKWAVDAVAPINDFGVPTSAVVSEALGLRGLGVHAAEVCVDKYKMRRVWNEAGLPCPTFELVKNKAAFKQAVANIGMPCICKPTVSGGASRGVLVIRQEADIAPAFIFAAQFAMSGEILIEQFVTGLEHSAEVVVQNGRARMLAISDKIKTPLPHRVDKDVIYPSKITGDQLRTATDLVQQAAVTAGITDGVAHVEMCTTEQGPYLYEIGARPGGGHTGEVILPYLTGINEFVLFVSALLGLDYKNEKPAEPRAAVYHFLTPQPGILDRVEGLEQIRQRSEVLDADVFVQPGGEIRPVRVGGDRAGFLVIGCGNRNEALDVARQCENELTFHYR